MDSALDWIHIECFEMLQDYWVSNMSEYTLSAPVLGNSCGPFHMDEQRWENQLEPIYCSSVSIHDVSLKTY